MEETEYLNKTQIYITNQKGNRIELTAVQRRLGEYCNSLEARSIASGGIRLWKT